MTDMIAKDGSVVTETNETILRRLLWLRHGCETDKLSHHGSGEMKCSSCLVDFKRADPFIIERVLSAVDIMHSGQKKNDP